MPTGLGFTHNLAGTLDGLTLLDQTIGTEQHNTDLAGLEVHAHALDTGGEPAHLISSMSRGIQARKKTYSTSSSAWTLLIPWTRAIPSLLSNPVSIQSCAVNPLASDVVEDGRIVLCLRTYPTERTRPVSARPDSSWTPRILCSRMEETSVGEALASEA